MAWRYSVSSIFLAINSLLALQYHLDGPSIRFYGMPYEKLPQPVIADTDA
jgi:hypothetical protein